MVEVLTNRCSAVHQMKCVTPSGLCERLKINVSLARAACKYLAAEGSLAPVVVHSKQMIFTKNA